MRYALVVWDFDGTLADTLENVLQIFNEIAPGFGLAPITDAQTLRDTTPMEFLRTRKIPLWKLPALRQAVVARQREAMAHIRLHPGIPDVLAQLGRKGCQMGIVSSNAEENIRICLRAHATEPWFEFIVGYPRLFGKQRMLRRIVRQRGLAPHTVLYVGDEVRDILAARDAGMDVAAVTWGANSPGLLARHAPTHLVREPDQLCEVLLGPNAE